jgi:hypothetical protein
MSSVILSNDLSRELSDLREQVEVRDACGNLLGVFEPIRVLSDSEIEARLSRDGCPSSVDEYRRQQLEVRQLMTNPGMLPPGSTTEEVLGRLKSQQ